MMRPACAALVLVIATSAPLTLAAGAENQFEISQLVRQLGSHEFAARQAATATLENLGGPALTELGKAAQGSDPEVRWRATELSQRIARRMEASRLLDSQPVHVVARDVPVVDALADFAKETGVSIKTVGNQLPINSKSVNLDINAKSFWEALDQLCHQTGLTEFSLLSGQNGRGPTPTVSELGQAMAARRMRDEIGILTDVQHGSSNEITLVASDPVSFPTFYGGAVRIRAVPTRLFGMERPSADGPRVLLDVAPQPQLAWRGVREVRVRQAIDDRGQSLTQSLSRVRFGSDQVMARNGGYTDFNRYPHLNGPAPQRIAIDLKPGNQPTTSLSRLEGTVIAQMQTPFEPIITVEPILQAGGRTFKTRDGLSLKIVDVTREGDDRVRVQVSLQDPTAVRVAFAGRRALPGNRILLGNNGPGIIETPTASPWTSFSLLDDKGHRYALRGVENRVQGQPNGVSQESSMTYVRDRKQGKPAKFLFSGQRTVFVEIPFELRDVPLN
jgi:hypothetical protein